MILRSHCCQKKGQKAVMWRLSLFCTSNWRRFKSRGADDYTHSFGLISPPFTSKEWWGKTWLQKTSCCAEAKGRAPRKTCTSRCREVLLRVCMLLILPAECRCTVRHSCGGTARKRFFCPFWNKNLAKIDLGRWFLLSEKQKCRKEPSLLFQMYVSF
jgi:hypothetical protein